MMIDHVLRVMESARGQTDPDHEVDLLEHALQCAHLARQARATDAMIAAALLHDIGHLLAAGGDDILDEPRDAEHAELGAKWLELRFPESVCRPVALHVAAKRFWMATSPGYFDTLCVPSQHSLALQGMAMSSAEVAAFRRNAYAEGALVLRAWDDAAKCPGLDMPPLGAYRALLASLAGAPKP